MTGLFKAYDVRGIYGTELTEKFAYNLAKAILHYTKAKRIVIGYDSRVSNIALFNSFSRALVESGKDVVNIGLVSRPMLNWVAWKYKYDLGVIITASHNPKEYNGFKFLYKGKPLSYDDGLNQVELLMQDGARERLDKKYSRSSTLKTGRIIRKNYLDAYISFLSRHLSKEFISANKKHTVNIVADASNGAAGNIIHTFLEKNHLRYAIINSEPDGTFPAHDPNPLHNDALLGLSRTVMKKKADFGFIVDPDADRIRFVDDTGRPAETSYIAAILAQYFIHSSKRKNAKRKKTCIVHDLISRKVLSETIKKSGGKEIISKVGFANVSNSMRMHNAVFGCETSSHYCFKKMNFLDSGMMMLVEFLNALYSKDNRGKKLSEILAPLDRYFDAGELNYPLGKTKDKMQILRCINEYYTKNSKRLSIKSVDSLDGVSVHFKDCWFNVRPSNTEPLLRVRIEAARKEDVARMKKDIEKFISA